MPHQAGSHHNRSHLNVETHDSSDSDSGSDSDSDGEKRKAIARALEDQDAKGMLYMIPLLRGGKGKGSADTGSHWGELLFWVLNLALQSFISSSR